MKFLPTVLCWMVVLLSACNPGKTTTEMSDQDRIAHADTLAHKFIIVDTHIDVPERLSEQHIALTPDNLGILVSTRKGDFDYERAVKGGLNALFMSIYVPSSYQLKADMGKSYADSLMDMVSWITNGLPDKFAAASTPAQVIQNFGAGKISMAMGLENGAPIGNNLSNVAYFFNRGIRYITLTHAKDNQICDSSYDSTRTWKGLSPYGRQVVEEMNRVGIMVDISHVSDSTFYQVMRISKAPCIASHSSCRAYTPGFERNMNDDMIKLLAKNGGVIQINIGSTFLDSAVAAYSHANDAELNRMLKEKGLKEGDEGAEKVAEEFYANHPRHYADVKNVADHIEHVVQLAGIDHVGIGTDFDGVGDSLPTGMKDVSTYPNLIAELLKRGFTDADIEKICSGNLFRVWNQVAQVANELQKGS